MKVGIVIPVLNQLDYTRQCVESLLAAGVPGQSILVIDNASTDDTPQWLAATRQVRSLRNPVNLGCGSAWTQGAVLMPEAEWVVFLNNDVLFAHDAIGASIAAAEARGHEVVSPALMEGQLDYDLAGHTRDFVARMVGEWRENYFHAVCFAVRRDVLHRIGFPDTDRALFGREDIEYLVRCRRNKVPMGVSGAGVLHHFGSVTQSALKLELGVRNFGDNRYLYSRLGMGWWARKRFKAELQSQADAWRVAEKGRHGLTLHMERQDGRWTMR